MSAESPIPVHGRGFTIPGGGVAEIIIIGGTPYPAATIVKAVASHDALVAALKIGREAARWRAKGTHDCDCDRCKQHRADVAAIDAALKLAGETP